MSEPCRFRKFFDLPFCGKDGEHGFVKDENSCNGGFPILPFCPEHMKVVKAKIRSRAKKHYGLLPAWGAMFPVFRGDR